MRQVTYKIKRFDGEKSFIQEYTFTHEAGRTILWSLLKIKDEIDETLTFTAACRSAVCGACAVRVNGQPVLACETGLDDMLTRHASDVLLIEPLHNFAVIRDLVVDWENKVARMKQVKPWLIPRGEFTPDTGCRQSPDEFKQINSHADCILCGSCASECSKLSVNGTDFLEPFIYTRAQKMIADSRDAAPREHLKPAVEGGAWKCMHCQQCSTHCPKGLEPAEDVSRLRRAAVKDGMTDNAGVRHAQAFYEDILATGRLNEAQLAMKTEGFFKAIKRLPFALRLLKRGKLNPLHRPVPIKGIEHVRAIVRAVKEAGET